jgi:multidrug efflux pump subunit AcrB
VGVVPMIVSGSSLWAPLGSLIASGILVSMVLTLIVIPVLYVVVVEKRKPVPVVKAVPMPAPAQA